MNPLRFSKILIVDDSDAFRAKIKSLLIEAQVGYYFYEAKDGLEAISQYIAKKPHIVIMDIMMPKVNGIQAVNKIIQINPYAKIIVTSTKDNKELVNDAIRGGAKDYVIKPFVSGSMVMAISKQLLEKRYEKKLPITKINSKSKPLMHNGIKYGDVDNIKEDGEFEMSVNADSETEKLLEVAKEIKDMGSYYEILV
ncbi:MAG: response regulator transcription factor [Candidatus Nitrosopumilus sp. bin_68KS]